MGGIDVLVIGEEELRVLLRLYVVDEFVGCRDETGIQRRWKFCGVWAGGGPTVRFGYPWELLHRGGEDGHVEILIE